MRPTLCWFCCLWLLVSVAGPSSAAETVWGGVVSGKVVGPDGKPVGDAAVCIVVNQWDPREWKDFEIKTKRDGSFAFRPLRDAQYAGLVFAVKPGLGAASLQIEERKNRTGLTLRLKVGAPVEVRVTDSGGAPVSGAILRMLQGSWSRAVVISYYDCLTARTDAAGKVSVPWLGAAETARLMVEHPNYGTHERTLLTPSGPLDIRLLRAARITGRVLHAGTLEPESYVEVGCQRLQEWEQGLDSAVSTTSPDASGEYVLDNLLPGDYLVYIRDPVLPARWVALRAKISSLGEGGSAKCPDLLLQTGAVVTGKVVNAKSGAGIAFAVVGAKSAGGERWNQYYEVSAYGDGTFSLRVPSGSWTITPRDVSGYLTGTILEREFKEGDRAADVVLKLTPAAGRAPGSGSGAGRSR